MKNMATVPRIFLENWDASRDDLVLFTSLYASPPGKNYEPLPHQLKFAREIRQGGYDEAWMSGGNSAGKTWTAKWIGVQWACHKIKPGKPAWTDYDSFMKAPYNILCTGPEQKQAVELWETIVATFKDSPILRYRVDEIRSSTRLKQHPFIRLKNGTYIEAVGLHDKGKHVEGEAYDLVLINEPADVRNIIHCVEKVLTQRTWRRGGIISGFGTPKGRGEYYLLFRKGLKPEEGKLENPYLEPRVFSMYADSRDNPFADQSKIQQFLQTRNQPLITERIEGKFIEESALAFPEGQIEEMFDDKLKLPIKSSSGHFYITGVDFGRKEDYTCAITLDITGGYPPFTVVNFYRKGGGVATWEEILGDLLTIYNDYYGEFIVDATASAGDMQMEWLRDLGISFIPYQFAGSPAKKSNLITNLQRLLGNKEIKSSYINQLREEMHLYPKNMDDKGMETDTVMSLALAGFGAKEYGPMGSIEHYVR